jgi:uncharacterized protein DUF397
MDVNGATWRKATRSTNNGGNCVEVARLPGTIGVRDSKNPKAGHLAVSAEAFGDLLNEIRAGEHGV